MARIAVYHPIFGTGGGEAVCMNVLEALQDEHEVCLYTLSDIDFRYLNEYFNTSVSSEIKVRSGGSVGTALRYFDSAWSTISNQKLGRLQASVFGRLLRSRFSTYDLTVSTFGEFSFDAPSVQYVHYPMFNRRRIPESIESRGMLRRVYDEACDILSGNRLRSTDDIVLANSEWTANLTEQVHQVPVELLYPPVDTEGFRPQPWECRAEGFVAIGRLAPSKRIEALIEIVERLHERGHDVPLHIVGPAQNKEYYESVRTRVAGNDRIRLEGRVNRERLIEFVCSHKHFGIVVAEFVAGGAIPFVHDSGGQREIVDKEEPLCYRSIPDAVEKIERVLTDPDEQMRIKRSLPDIRARFGKERFKREFRHIVREAVES
jgi:glycosyltransferase involved in cell wall biosynthesis